MDVDVRPRGARDADGGAPASKQECPKLVGTCCVTQRSQRPSMPAHALRISLPASDTPIYRPRRSTNTQQQRPTTISQTDCERPLGTFYMRRVARARVRRFMVAPRVTVFPDCSP